MKSVITTIIVVAGLGLMVATNPDMDAFEQYQKSRIADSASQHGQLGTAIGSLVAGLGGKIAASATTRSNYLFFSTFKTRLGASSHLTLGLLGHFVEIDTDAPEK